MAAPDLYWLKRLRRDAALVRRAEREVYDEMRRIYRNQYRSAVRNMEALYAEAQARGTLSRTKLWNYLRWRDLEADFAEFREAGSQAQRAALYSALDGVFRSVIGADAAAFDRRRLALPTNPRAVIDTAWSGEDFSTRIWKNNDALAQRVREMAQQIVNGNMNAGDIRGQLMREFDVTSRQAERLVVTESSYVLNRAELVNYQGLGVRKVCIVPLEVNTCERCHALAGEVFRIDDAPALPIHPYCHCAYCVPRDGDDAEVTASGADLDAVYARKIPPKQFTPRRRRNEEE